MLSRLEIASECVLCVCECGFSLVCVAILLSYSAVKSGMFANVHYTYAHLHSVNALATILRHTSSVQRIYNVHLHSMFMLHVYEISFSALFVV